MGRLLVFLLAGRIRAGVMTTGVMGSDKVVEAVCLAGPPVGMTRTAPVAAICMERERSMGLYGWSRQQ